MSRETNSKLVTGRTYFEGEPTPVSGFLTHTPNLKGFHLTAQVPVILLTPEGERLHANVEVIDVLGVQPRDFTLASDRMLWHIAKKDMHGLGAHVLAELAYRENALNREVERAQADRIAKSRRDANVLMGR